MAYSEVKNRNKNKYYYRVISIRDGKKVNKKRIYLGVNLGERELRKKELKADIELNKNNELEKIIPKIKDVLIKNNVKKAGIFGSFASGKQKLNSDIDILIKPPKGIGFGFARIEADLEKKVKRRVDLVSYNGISPYLRKSILNEEVKIL